MRLLSFVAVSIAALLLVAPSVALTQGTPIANTPAPAETAVANRIDQRIKSLHGQLKITAAQEAQWAAVAQVIRDNAHAVDSLIRERHAKAGKMTAVDDLRSYQAIADAHAAGTAKLVSAFEPLYTAMSPDQQKNADTVFARSMRRPAKRNKNSK